MKTIAILTRIIPTLSGVCGSGIFNVVVGNEAVRVREEIRKAANDDLISADLLLASLAALGSARRFEEQQKAVHDTVDAADALLGAIRDGSVMTIDRVPNTVGDLLTRLRADVASIQDVFRPSQTIIGRIRRDAAELSMLVDAGVHEGVRDADQAAAAATIYDHADRLRDDAPAQRGLREDAIRRGLDRIAA